MSHVTFTGQWSAQEAPGETVSIIVTKPDGTTETLTTTTQADASFSLSQDYNVAGNYSAHAHVDADAVYQAADTEEVSFVVPLQPRTGTLNVSVT